jgi:hypothetical protein
MHPDIIDHRNPTAFRLHPSYPVGGSVAPTKKTWRVREKPGELAKNPRFSPTRHIPFWSFAIGHWSFTSDC